MLRSRRATPLAAAAALLALGACSDTMGPTMPNAGRLPADAPALAKGKGADAKAATSGTIAVIERYYDGQEEAWIENGLVGTTVRFTGSNGKQRLVQDNSADDFDARGGYYRVTLPGADSYTATLVTIGTERSLVGMTVQAPYGSPVTRFSPLMPPRSPQIKVYFVSNLTGEKVFGRGATITGPNGFTFSAVDGGTGDSKNSAGAYYPADGRITTYVPELATYKACQITLGFLNPPCATGTATHWDQEFDVVLPVKP
jgi:hypothetical protein